MLRFPRSAAGVSIAVLATSAIAPPAIAAAQAPSTPPYQTRGLLDGLLGGLGDVLGNLLGSSQQAQLTQLLGILQGLPGGTNPSSDVLRPLTDILTQLGGASGLPVPTRDLVAQLTALLNSGRAGVPLDGSLLAPVANLLRQLAATDGLPTAVTQLLDSLADVLAGNGTSGLPIGSLDLLPDVINGLNDTLNGLLRGNGTPTADLLAPLIPLLRQVAATDGIPQALRDLINQLIETLSSTTGALDPLLTSQLSTVLSLIANTPGVSRETRTTIERTTTILNNATPAGTGAGGAGGSGGSGGSSGGTGTGTGAGGGGTGGTGLTLRRAATTRDKAVVKRVAINKQRTIASVRIACPKAAPAVCATTLRAAVSGKTSKAVSTRIGQNTSKLVKLKLTRAATKQLKRSGGKIAVSATTAFGTKKFTANANLTVRKPAAKAKARK